MLDSIFWSGGLSHQASSDYAKIPVGTGITAASASLVAPCRAASLARPRTRMIGARGRGLPSNCFFLPGVYFFARRVDLYFSFPVSIFSCPASIFFARHLLVFARRLSTAGLSSGNTSRVRNLFFVARRSSTASASSENTSRLRNLFFLPGGPSQQALPSESFLGKYQSLHSSTCVIAVHVLHVLPA